MYENVYGKTPPKFGENAVTLPLDVDGPWFFLVKALKCPQNISRRSHNSFLC